MAAPKNSKTTTQDTGSLSAAAKLIAKLDRTQFGPKTRLYALAKQIALPSSALVSVFAEQGVKKAAQSSLSPDEVAAALDAIVAQAGAPAAEKKAEEKAEDRPKKKAAKKAAKTSAEKAPKKTQKKAAKKAEKAEPETAEPAVDETVAPAAEEKPKKRATKKSSRKATRKAATKKTEAQPAAEAAETEQPADAEDEKLRERVRKNVENEISQIETKVEAELEEEKAELATVQVETPEEKPKKSRRRATKRTKKSDQAQAHEEPKQESAEGAENAEDAMLRERVRKNVANEISQIEEKVEAELEEGLDDAAENTTEDAAEQEHDQSHEPDVEQLHEALVEAGEDFDEDFAPITPKPETDTSVDYAPVFMAPTPRRGRRRAVKRTSQKQDPQQERQQHEQQPHENEHSSKQHDKQDHHDEPERIEEPRAIRGSTRIEAQKRRRREMREKGRERKHIVSQAEFLARRESVERTMVVRDKERTDGHGTVTQVGVLEDGLLVEHFVTSESQASMIGNIYLGRVQNVLPSMEAAFVDIGQGRNGVLYAGEVDWRRTGLGGRQRKIEHALKSGDQILVQVAKDPVGAKGARLTTQISLAGRYLVYVPGGRNAGISRKLPVPERKRLKEILNRVVPDDGGAIIRTAAENVSEEAIGTDVRRLHTLWEDITERANKEKNSKGAKPVTLYEEPDLLVKVVRDLFNEDFSHLVVDGRRSYNTVDHYVQSVAPDLADRVERFDRREHGGADAFETFRIDEQLHKALSRKVWLPSGGTLVIDRTEAMTVIDVNTGKFTGSGGNLEETVTRNNLEAAEEIVRQMRLRDMGGMIVVDFIDMVLPENQDLVLRRLKEALGRDRTRHQVSEVTSLGLVQMTRKRLGTGLIETFSTECEACHGRGLIIHEYPVDESEPEHHHGRSKRKRPAKPDHPAAKAMHVEHKNEQRDDEHENKREDKPSLEDLAASVVAGGHDAQEDDHEERKPQRRRRRGSRGSNRGRDKREEQKQEVDAAEIAYAAAEHAEELDDVQEFQSHIPDEEHVSAKAETNPEKTYEEAVAEFEASPRRKRRTRGNSRSDRRPRREDFQRAPEPSDVPLQQPEQESPAEIRTVSSRGRRRAVRRATRRQAQAQPEAQRKETVEKQSTEEKRASASSRGRRRAVKRFVKTSEPQAAEGSRGRRRAARRNRGL
ncbi:Rne/Rng family ribonuclease [uncultured Corynebacterium sp.]|uniref:Rne/Rng family ribonuclease n=1 Tax=uncultured Corynebacterium sp. TaxID=159447 RepID=UPI00259ADB01|nr:Rne/Rng family ribonuclease [uncultured Corynebacterium sp.]